MSITLSTSAAPLTPANFRFVADLVAREAAITLEAGKEYLVETRLAPMAADNGHASVNGLVEQIRAEPEFAQRLRGDIVESLTTNETLFFRDVHPFETLRRHILPKLIAARSAQRRLTIWSAASSTGQEAYSIAMLIAEHFPQLATWDVRIIGTDLSSAVVRRARTGTFHQVEVNRGLPAPYLVKYFRQQNGLWHLVPEIRNRVEFRELNLIRPWHGLGPFDVVFMRYVLIYFSEETKRSILREARRVMSSDGYFFLGGAENAMAYGTIFTPQILDRTTVYQPAR